ncbi:MAG: hypothetical protein ACI8RZ_005892 [Myxococcota bacterium]|jgi:hypothetical protein
MPLSDQNRAIATLARDITRKRPELKATASLATIRDNDAMAAALVEVRAEVERLYRQGRRKGFETSEGKKQAAHALSRADRESDGIRRVAEAVKSVDSWLVRNSNLATRLKDGRRSLTSFKLDRHLRDLMIAEAEVEKDRVVVTIDAQRIQQIQADLTSGQQAWTEYVLREVYRDLQMAVHDAWSVLEADLPVEPPTLPELIVPWSVTSSGTRAWWEAPAPPDLREEYPLSSFLSQLGRTVRTQMTSLLMVASLAGLASMRGSAWMGLVVLFMLPVGWFVVQRDRQKKIEELAEKGLKATSMELERWVESRLNRTEGRIRDYAAYQLQVPIRDALKAWYRAEVMPRKARAVEKLQEAKTAVKGAEDALRSFDRDWKMDDIDRLRTLIRTDDAS